MDTEILSSSSSGGEVQATASELLIEYAELRKEILQNDSAVLELLKVILAIVGVLMAFALINSDALTRSVIFLICCFFAWFGVYQYTDRMKNTTRLSNYLRVFVEPELKIKWENRITRYRELVSDRSSEKGRSHLERAKYKFKFKTDQRFIYIVIVVMNTALGFIALGQLISEALEYGRPATWDQGESWMILMQSASIGIFYLLIMAAIVHQTKTTLSSKDFDQIKYWWEMIKKEEGSSHV